MTFEGAVIKEQGVTFAVVAVKRRVVQSRSLASQTIQSFKTFFPGCPVVLMAQDSRGRPTYFGRPDLARFLANVSLWSIPWKKYRI